MNCRILLIAIMLTFVSACGDNPADDYTDSLTLGTGLGSQGKLTGVSDTFAVPSGDEGIILHWALESSYDIGGGFMIALVIEQKSGDSYVERAYLEYETLNERDVYYYIESFFHSYGTGSFRATAYVGIRRIASKNYAVTLQ